MTGSKNGKDKMKMSKLWVAVSIVVAMAVMAWVMVFLGRYIDAKKATGTGAINDGQVSGDNNGGVFEIEGMPEVTPEPTDVLDAGPVDEWSEVYSCADLDEDGTEEYILIEGGDFLNQNIANGRITVYVNNEPVYQYTEELRIMCVNQMEYLDLDGDGEEEIFVSFVPDVNSMPLMEWFVLKKTDDGWKMLEMYHSGNNMTDNGFPISVILKNGQFEFAIRCEGWEGEVALDATEHYENLKAELEMGNGAYNTFIDAAYEVGDVVGGTLAYGIWNIQADTYEEQNCLVAEHGLGGMDGKYDYYGNVFVYFDYNADGKIRILDVTFEKVKY